jgi:LmbE family N-acetylglucosaminyl deacetylase
MNKHFFSAHSYRLLVIAHPDDETIFFSSLLFQKRDLPWHVVCVTDANADKRGHQRLQEFATALERLQVSSYECLGLPDIYEHRLNIDSIQQHFADWPPPKEVFTHNILGEYMHPHHQDVSFAVHQCWHQASPVYHCAYNCQPDFVLQLLPGEFRTKCEILSQIYGQETIRFANLIPATFTEGFFKPHAAEINEIYTYVTQKSHSLDPARLNHFKWFYQFIKGWAEAPLKRAF